MIVLKYNEFEMKNNVIVMEAYNGYKIGDIVLIRYWMTGDITPVKIIEKPMVNNFVVSHKIDGSQIFNAPDQNIKASEILGFSKDVENPFDQVKRITENPSIRPGTSKEDVPSYNSPNHKMGDMNNSIAL